MEYGMQIQFKDNEFKYNNFETFEAACEYAETTFDLPDNGEWEQTKESGDLYNLESYLNCLEIYAHVVK
jgi:hypothetical protein